MAPHNQQIGTAKRKRPAEVPAAGKQDTSKKPADTTNKKAKTSTDDKSASVKKLFSDALPVGPLTISKLKGPGKEEAVFPRGGGSVLTPLELKEVTNQAVKDVLFETGASMSGERNAEGNVDLDGEEKKPKHKKRKTEHAKKGQKKGDTEKEDTGPKVEGLSFKRIVPGTIVLGCISKINSTDITVSLPNNLIGYVPITSISEQLTKRIESLLEDEENDKVDQDLTNLDNYFRVGQYIRACVISTGEDIPEKSGKNGTSSAEHTKHKKRIELSLHPSFANAGVTVKELVAGSAIQASITSVEDHGCIVDLGLEDKSITGFISSKELGSQLTLRNVQEGQVILCTITGMASNGKVVKVSGEIDKPIGAKKGKGDTWKGGLWLAEAPTIDTFTPGTGVEVLVTDVKNGGIRGKIMGMLDIVIDYFHGRGWSEKALEERIKIGSKIQARVLFTNPNSDPKKLNLSILPHTLSLSSPLGKPKEDPTTALPIATILDKAKVTKVEPKLGLFIDVGIAGVPGFVHISRIADKKIDDLSETTGSYKVGSVHRARIIGYNAIDGIFFCSMEQKILDQKYLRVEDVKVGEVVKGTIQKHLPNGSLIIELSDGITAIVDENHLSDVKLKSPEKKFREGMAVTGRILMNDPAKKQLRMTIKKTLVNSDAPIITSYENAAPGMVTPGTLVKVLPSGAVVKFYSDVTAFLPVGEMSEAYIQDPREHFRVGQSVIVNVLSVDVENERIRVSCKDPKAFGEAQQNALAGIQIGQIISGIVTEKSATDLVLALQDMGADGLKGTLLFTHLVDGSKQKAVQAFKNIRVGQTLKDILVLGKLEARRLIMLSLKPSLVSAAKEGKLVKGVEDVKEGDALSGYVSNITLHNALVTFPGGGSGAVSRSGMPLEKVSSLDYGLMKNQSITATVCRIDHGNDRFYLTLNKYEGPQKVEKPQKGGNAKNLEERAKAIMINKPLDGSLRSMADIAPGKITKAKILSIKETQLNMQVAENIQGRIDITQVFDSWSDIMNKKKPLQQFRKDQILDVKITGIHDARNHRFLPITHKQTNTRTVFELSAREECLKEDSEVLTLDKIEVGSSWVAFVNNHGEDCVWVNLSPSVRGRIKILELSDDAGPLKDLDKNFPIGCAVKCHVTHVDIAKNKLDLSARTTNFDKAITYDSLEKGQILPARVTKVTEKQVIVQLSEHVFGPIGLTDLADNYSLAQPSKYTKNEILRVCVVDVDKVNKRVALSTRPSRVLSSISKVADPEILTLAGVTLGDVRRGFVKHISDKGVFVHLGGIVTAYVKVSDISDFFVKEWKTAVKVNQLVRGKITHVEQAVGQVQMSLKPSVVDGKVQPQIQWNELLVGQVVKATVRSTAEYGVFVVVDGSANVSGLCHKSEVSDKKVQNVRKLYSPGDAVKAKVLSIDLEKRKISFGLKASYFEGEGEDVDVDGDEKMADSEDDESDGGVDVATAIDFNSDEEVEEQGEGEDGDEVGDAEMSDAPPLTSTSRGPALSTSGFDWAGSILDSAPTLKGEDVDSDSDTFTADRKMKKKSMAAKIKHDMTGDLDTRAPESVSDFERLLMGNPQNGELWVRYMAFQLQLSEVGKSREIAERALKTISSVSKEGLEEKKIIWAAMLNTELEYGTDESLEEVFKRACVYNDSLDMHERLCNIYIQAGKHEKADSLYQAALKKHGSTTLSLWTTYATYLFSPPISSPDRARAILPRALQILPKTPESTHRSLISKFAQLEFTRGDPERGRTIFENLTSTYKGKSDLLIVWVDMEMKLAKGNGEVSGVRGLLERKLGVPKGGEEGKTKVKPKVAKVLFKKWLEWEEKNGDKMGVKKVQRLATEWAEEAKKEKVDKDRMKMITGDD
ncbi:hypothetical protein BGX38DRAFT_1181201, partial [Terfezia claveryi]